MKKLFYILLAINFVAIIVVPVIISVLAIEEDFAATYVIYFVIPIFFTSLLILLGFVIAGFFKSLKEKEPKDQSRE